MALALTAVACYCEDHRVGILAKSLYPLVESGDYDMKVRLNGCFRRVKVTNTGKSKVKSLNPEQGWMSLLANGLLSFIEED